jgi:hypothetical protein
LSAEGRAKLIFPIYIAVEKRLQAFINDCGLEWLFFNDPNIPQKPTNPI